jgi:hypothetical protein
MKIMKKTTILVVLAFLLSAVAFAQVGIGTTTPAPDAVLELASPSKALLVTRVANTAAVAAPVNGMIIYDIAFNCIKKYQNGVWSECNATTAPVIATLNCAGAVFDGTLTSGTAASGVTVTIPYTGGNGGTYTGQLISSTGVTGLYATLLMGTLATGADAIIYTITGTPNGSGTASFAVNFLGKSCSFTATVQGTTPPQVLSLNCAAAVLTGSLVANSSASGAFVSYGYTGGNGSAYNIQFISSTGVNGLTAQLPAGTLASGDGSLVFSLSGAPTNGGVASFAFSLGGQSCSFTVNVDSPPNISSWSNCSSALTGTLTQGVPTSGVTQTATYTGGNGGNYPAFSFSSSGVGGLVATTAAGNLANGAGSIIFTITGTPTSSGTATFNLTLFDASCVFTRTIAPPTISGLTCASAAFSPTTITLNTAYSGTMTVPYTGGNSATYPSGAAINSTGVTGLTATLQAGTLASGSGNLIYTVSGTPTSSGPTTASFALSFGGQNCTVTKAITIPAPVVTTLVCSSPVFTPTTITQNTAYSGNFTVTYTGGNNVPYVAGSAINSTGVTGLTATLQAGSLSNNAGGTLTFAVSGTPTTSGTASFALSFGTQTCTVTKTVNGPTITGLTCGSATFNPNAITQNTAYSGTMTVPYTGGNGVSYAADTGIASTGVTGLTATLQAGTLANGSGNLTYTVSGTPTTGGNAVFALSFGGQSCSVTKVVSSFPTSYTGTVTFPSRNHLPADVAPVFFDGFITYTTQDSNYGDMADLRLHQDAGPGNADVVQTILNTPILVGGQIKIRWSRRASATGLGLIVEFKNGATTSQPSIDSRTPTPNIMTNSTQTNSGDDMTITINVVALTDTIIIKSSEDGDGPDPYLLEIEVFDNNNVKIPIN